MTDTTELNRVLTNEQFHRVCQGIYDDTHAYVDDEVINSAVVDDYDPYEMTMGADPDDPAMIESYCWENFFDEFSNDIQAYIQKEFADSEYVLTGI